MAYRMILSIAFLFICWADPASAGPEISEQEWADFNAKFGAPMLQAMDRMGKGDFGAALAPMREVHEGAKAVFTKERFPDGTLLYGNIVCNHGFVLLKTGRVKEAAPLIEQGYGMILRNAGTDTEDTALIIRFAHTVSMAELRTAEGRDQLAIDLLESQHAFADKIFAARNTPGNNPLRYVALNALMEMHIRAGRLEEARKAADRAIQIMSAGVDAESLRNARFNLGKSVSDLGAPALALELIAPCVAETRALARNPLDLGSQTGLAASLFLVAHIENAAGNHEACRAVARESLEIHERLFPKALLPNGDPHVGELLAMIARSHEKEARFDLAATEYRKALDLFRKLAPASGERQCAVALHNLGLNQLLAGHLTESLALLGEADAMKSKRAEPMEQAATAQALGMCLLEMGRHAESVAAQEGAWKLFEKMLPDEAHPLGHPAKLAACHCLVECLLRAGKWPEALKLSERRLAWVQPDQRPAPGVNPLAIAEAHHQHGEICLKFGKWADARAAFKHALRILDDSPRVARAKPLTPYLEFETLGYLAGLALLRKDNADMEAMQKRVAALFPRMIADREPTRTWASSIDKLAIYWKDQGQDGMATALRQSSRQVWARVCERYPSAENRGAAKANLEALAAAFEKGGRIDDSRKVAAEAAAIPR